MKVLVEIFELILLKNQVIWERKLVNQKIIVHKVNIDTLVY
jgi:hypothetical protein